MLAACRFSLTFSVMAVMNETCEHLICRKVMNLCHIRIYFVNQRYQMWEKGKTLTISENAVCAECGCTFIEIKQNKGNSSLIDFKREKYTQCETRFVISALNFLINIFLITNQKH